MITDVSSVNGAERTIQRQAVTYLGKWLPPGEELCVVPYDRRPDSTLMGLAYHFNQLEVREGAPEATIPDYLGYPAANISCDRLSGLRRDFRRGMKGKNVAGLLYSDCSGSVMESLVSALEGQELDDFIILGMKPGFEGISRVGTYGKRVGERAGAYCERVGEWLKSQNVESPLIVGGLPLGIHFGRKLASEMPDSKFQAYYPVSEFGREDIKDRDVVITEAVHLTECDETLAHARRGLRELGANRVLYVAEYARDGQGVDFSCFPIDSGQ